MCYVVVCCVCCVFCCVVVCVLCWIERGKEEEAEDGKEKEEEVRRCQPKNKNSTRQCGEQNLERQRGT